MEIKIGQNESGQRLDRFLRKYFNKAPLSLVYKMIRKDVKVNGKRSSREQMLKDGDELKIYISDDRAKDLRQEQKSSHPKKQFHIAYEDEDMLAAVKPAGLLTHGDSREKKNTLAAQVTAYMIRQKSYDPRAERTFVPSPVNRLDRNTSGLVIFGKNAAALRELNKMIRERDAIGKFYCTIAAGEIGEPLKLSGRMVKDEKKNMVRLTDDENGAEMKTDVYPVMYAEGFTLAMIRLHTGRTHQIRVQMAGCGHPLAGDSKYGNRKINAEVKRKCGLTTHLLHAGRLEFYSGKYEGLSIKAEFPAVFRTAARELMGIEDIDRILKE